MIPRGGEERDRAGDARKADTPWRQWRPKKSKTPLDNARRNREARARMSQLEAETGMTEAEYEAFHAEQRARVFKRYGIERAA